MNEQHEDKIVTTLKQYAPKPGLHFYRQMAGSPWNKKEQATHLFHFGKLSTVIASLILVIIALSLSIPSVRAAVLNYLGLGVSQSETIPNPAIPAESLVDSQKVDDISNLAGWEIKVPTWLPEDYQFSDAMFDSSNNMVLLTFLATRQLPGDDPNMTETKAITLVQALHNDILPLMVAPSTNVLNITVDDQPAAYAVGAWENDFSTGQATWNNSYILQNIYWQIDDVFINLNTDDTLVSKEDLIKMADSVN